MFANEDFDLDEDFLNDVSQKESQTFSSDEEGSAKRIKKDDDSSQRSYTNSVTNLEKLIHDKSKKIFLVGNNNDLGDDKTIYRTNLILERLKRNENTISGSSISQRLPKIDSQSLNLEKSSSAEEQISHPTNDKCRKTLILEALKRNKVESISTRQHSPEKKSYPTDLNNDILNNSRLERCKTVGKPQLKPATTFKQPVTLVRQFPGPAGLLPHLSGEISPPLISESSCLDDSKNETDTDIVGNTSMISKYCSQNTTNSFSEEMDARLQNLNNSSHPCESVVSRVLSGSCSSNSKFECGPNIGPVRAAGNTNSRLHLRNLKNFGTLGGSSNGPCRPIVTGKSSAITNKFINSEASKAGRQEWTNLEKNPKDLNSFQGIKNSFQPTDRTNNKSTFESGDLQDFDDDLAASFFDIDDNLISKAVANNDPKTNSGIETRTFVPMTEEEASEKNSVLNATHGNAELSQEAIHVASKASNECGKSTEKSEATDTKITTASEAREKSNPTRVSDIKLKLSVFRSTTELTPQSNEDLVVASQTEISRQNNKCVESNFTSGLLSNGENDSDEELFSQLDVDAIFSQYNGLNDVN